MKNILGDFNNKQIKEIKDIKSINNSKKIVNSNNLSRTININFINSNSGHKKNKDNNSFRFLQDIPEKLTEGEKLTLKTTLIKKKENKYINHDPNKYHINFDLLEKARINTPININMTFI